MENTISMVLFSYSFLFGLLWKKNEKYIFIPKNEITKHSYVTIIWIKT